MDTIPMPHPLSTYDEVFNYLDRPAPVFTDLLTHELTKLRSEIDVRNKEVLQQVNTKNVELEEKIQRLERSTGVAVSKLEQNLEQTRKEVGEQRTKLAEMKDRNFILEEQVKQLETERESHQTEILKLKNRISSDEQWKSEMKLKVDRVEDATTKLVALVGSLISRAGDFDVSIKALEEFRVKQEIDSGKQDVVMTLMSEMTTNIKDEFVQIKETQRRTQESLQELSELKNYVDQLQKAIFCRNDEETSDSEQNRENDEEEETEGVGGSGSDGETGVSSLPEQVPCIIIKKFVPAFPSEPVFSVSRSQNEASSSGEGEDTGSNGNEVATRRESLGMRRNSQNAKKLHGVDIRQKLKNYCLCGMRFKGKEGLAGHIRHYTPDLKFPCSYCPVRFVGLNDLKKHVRVRHGALSPVYNIHMFGCTTCGQRFAKRSELREHQIESNHKNRSRARKAVKFSTLAGEGEVASVSTASPSKSEFDLSSCSSGSPSSQSEKVHGKDYARPFHCLCGMKFKKYDLTRHIRYYTGEKKFVCQECGMGFHYQSRLKSHVNRVHRKKPRRSNSQLHKCNHCKKGFRNLLTLASHLKTVHNVTPSKASLGDPNTVIRDADNVEHGLMELTSEMDATRFYCRCGRNYVKRQLLMVHIKKMITGKIFSCSECPRRFDMHSQLKLHLKDTHQITYRGGKFACSDCGDTFPSHKHLMAHRLAVHAK